MLFEASWEEGREITIQTQDGVISAVTLISAN